MKALHNDLANELKSGPENCLKHCLKHSFKGCLKDCLHCPVEDIHGRVTDYSHTGFSRAMDISVHSLIHMAHLAEPLMTRVGSGIAHFNELIDAARLQAPEQVLVTVEEVGNMAVMLSSGQARCVSGDTAYVEGGFHVQA